MKKILLLISYISLFCSCNLNLYKKVEVPEHLYKIHTDCLTEENAIETTNRYLTYYYAKIKWDSGKYDIKITDLGYRYYVVYSPKLEKGQMYHIRGGGYTVIIEKVNCDIIFCRPEP